MRHFRLILGLAVVVVIALLFLLSRPDAEQVRVAGPAADAPSAPEPAAIARAPQSTPAPESSLTLIPTPQEVEEIGGDPDSGTPSEPASALVHGIVIDENENPVASATIMQMNLSDRAPEAVGESEPDGSFEVTMPSPDFLICAEHERYVAVNDCYVRGFTSEGEIRLKLTSKFAPVEGRVIDQNGTPVPGVRVIMLPSGGLAPGGCHSQLVDSDEEGRFAFERVPAGLVHFWAHRDGALSTHDSVMVVAATPKSIVLTIWFEGTASISGTVSETDGTPIQGVFVAIAGGSKSGLRVGTLTGEDGKYELATIPACEVQATASRNSCGTDASAKFTLSENSRIEWNPALRPARVVYGVVEREDGTPLAGWSVCAKLESGVMYHGTSDASGEFEIEGANTGLFSLSATSSAQSYMKTPNLKDLVEAGPHRLVIPDQAIPSGSILGKIVDETGASIEGASISASSELIEYVMSAIRSSADGEFRFEDVVAAKYRLHVDKAGFAPAESGPYLVEPGLTDVGALTLVRLDRSAAIVVHLEAPGLEELPLCFPVALVDREDGVTCMLEQLAVADGVARSKKFIREGSYRLWIWGPHIVDMTVPVEISTLGEVREVNVSLRAGARRPLLLSHTPMDAQAANSRRRYVFSIPAERFEAVPFIQTPADGSEDRLELGLPFGKFGLEIRMNDAYLGSFPIEVSADDPSDAPISIDLRGG